MKHTAAKVIQTLCCMVVMLAVAAGITSVPLLAASNGVYIAKATPHYRHPVTGVIEDSGGDGSAVLGQSMTESALYPKALTEVDTDGNTYVTVRLKLMDNIQNPEFQVDGKSETAKLTQEDYTSNTADYRMKVNSENSVIRCDMYVVPMGRTVIFYITVSDLTPGSEDFITTVKTGTQKPAVSSSEPENTSNSQSAASAAAPSTDSSAAESREDVSSAATASNTQVSSTDSSSAAGLEEFDSAGNPVAERGSSKAAKSGNTAVWAVLGAAVVILACGGGVWYFGFFKKKK